jgi:hypothetical protein
MLKASAVIAIALVGAFALGKMSQPSPKPSSNLVNINYE